MAKMKAVQVPKAGADFERLPLSVSPKISSRIFGLESLPPLSFRRAQNRVQSKLSKP
jgi:hypothetical protein